MALPEEDHRTLMTMKNQLAAIMAQADELSGKFLNNGEREAALAEAREKMGAAIAELNSVISDDNT